MFGTVSTASYVGAFAGTGLAIYVQENYGWRYVFVPASVVGLGVATLVFWQLKTPKEHSIEIPGKVATTPIRTVSQAKVDNSFR